MLPLVKAFLAGVLGGIAMFVWTSIAHVPLGLGQAGIAEVHNESAVLNAMQSSMGNKTGLYIFPGLGVGKNATREEKNAAMKQMQQTMLRTCPAFSCIIGWEVSSHLENRLLLNLLQKCSRQFW